MREYAICWQGQYLRRVAGYRSDIEWTYDLPRARFYGDVVELDKHLLLAARGCPDGGPWPEVFEFEVTFIQKIDHSARFEKNRARAHKAEATRQANVGKVRQEEVQQEIERLERQLKWARERATS